MSGTTIATLTQNDFPAVLALNNANAAATSELDLAELGALVEQACYARGVGVGGDGFLIAVDQNAALVSPNFAWFKRRYERFLYIDRIVISEHARGQGNARRLYEDLFDCGSRLGHTVVGCEVNFDPPNPVSDAFHAALGFEVVGRAVLPGAKSVRYYARAI
jgi:predicted GNAT superfamily acetyltransferase